MVLYLSLFSCSKKKLDYNLDIPEPEQTRLVSSFIDYKDYKLRKQAFFRGFFYLASIENYYLDSLSDISKVDFLVFWGKDFNHLKEISYTQSGRYFFISSKKRLDFPLRSYAANIHIIPDKSLKNLENLEEGLFIYLEGYLVDIEKDSFILFKSSLSRKDIGFNSSEILYLTKLRILDQETLESCLKKH